MTMDLWQPEVQLEIQELQQRVTGQSLIIFEVLQIWDIWNIMSRKRNPPQKDLPKIANISWLFSCLIHYVQNQYLLFLHSQEECDFLDHIQESFAICS